MATMQDSNAVELFKGFNTLYTTNDFSDLTIVCRTRKWKVHKVVMSANCTFFRKACTGGFKVSDSLQRTRDDDERALTNYRRRGRMR